MKLNLRYLLRYLFWFHFLKSMSILDISGKFNELWLIDSFGFLKNYIFISVVNRSIFTLKSEPERILHSLVALIFNKYTPRNRKRRQLDNLHNSFYLGTVERDK